ncbi:NAD-dependent epimerase/dehydratase family protein [Halobacillus sp. A1]|uniref:NAD-dependent epimerase/dehydratase family protein n=1 Tax=Halobacillus sp. A1 TaxID=2880262 RepID=UPI0020A685DF|nr:NAD-dependent epimerase/dehydratase family protein [Halobacillus sp. A1]MCP3032931.1 NAD-dependent epimerase/dehydratase family protein [Halobacillus sp. A1]
MEKVLVTGGCGFIGSHIVENLVELGYKVTVIDDLSSGDLDYIDETNVKFYKQDVANSEVIEIIENEAPDYIIHQAAQVSVSKSILDINKDSKINIQGSVNLIKAAAQSNVKKIVFASSAAVYGNPEKLPVEIDHSINPLSPYGLSKYTVERYLKLAKDYYNVNYSILRYSNVFGPRQDAIGEGGVVAIFADRMINNLDISIHGDGEQTRDFVFVKDVADANVKALYRGDNSIFNVSSGERISVNELFNSMKEASHYSRKAIYSARRLGDIEHSMLDNEQTIANLNWNINYSIKQGIEETVDFYKSTSLSSENSVQFQK